MEMGGGKASVLEYLAVVLEVGSQVASKWKPFEIVWKYFRSLTFRNLVWVTSWSP